MRKHLPRGLRSTVTAAFTVGALSLSTALALATYFSARHYLIEQRERSALQQTVADAALVNDRLMTSGAQVSDVLGTVTPSAGTVAFVRRSGKWYSSSLEVPSDVIGPSMRTSLTRGDAAVAWTSDTDPNSVVVGIPMPGAGAEYYEVTAASELAKTLQTLQAALIISALLTAVGGAVLGRVAAGRLLSPLGAVTDAAGKISAGDFQARLDPTEDPDLEALVDVFNRMVATLDERLRRDARFAADVSHELKTPLTTLTTSLTVLKRVPDLAPRARAAVDLMEIELTRFQGCLEDLLALGQLDAAESPTTLERVDLRDAVSQSLAATGRPTDLLIDPADVDEHSEQPSSPEPRAGWPDVPDRLYVNIDKAQIARALANLFENADLHGGGLTRVLVAASDTSADVIVEDDGPGVAVDDRSRIFDRFARAGSRGSQRGTGLGLSIVAETARVHEGQVWCAASPTGGARLVMRLPLAPTRTDEDA